MPKLSIITINLNNSKGLQKTIESVVNQTITDFEYLVIDGGSTDGSVEVIKKYADKIAYWVSEPDKGIYNAMNKGIKVATGEYCLFLNSGDTLYNSDILNETSQYLSGKYDLICGSVHYWLNDKMGIKKPFSNFTMSKLLKKTLPHQGCFIRHKLFLDIGYYDENLKIVSDWEFFVQCAKYGVSYLPLDKIISAMEPNGISIINYNSYITERETRKSILFKNYIDDLNELNYLRNRHSNVKLKKYFKYIQNYLAIRLLGKKQNK